MMECKKFLCALVGSCLYEKDAKCGMTANGCRHPEVLSCSMCMQHKYCRVQTKYKYKRVYGK